MFTLEVHYSGKFEKSPDVVYVGGKVVYFSGFDPDFMSLVELKEMLKSLFLPINMPIYYKVPNGNFKRVDSETVVLEIFGMYRDTEHIVLYVGDMVLDQLHMRNVYGDKDNLENNQPDENANLENVNLNSGVENNASEDGGQAGANLGKEDGTCFDQVESQAGGSEAGATNVSHQVETEIDGNQGGENIAHQVESQVEGNLEDENESDVSDETYLGESDASTDDCSDLEFFLDGDSLSDTCDPIEDDDVVRNNNLDNDMGDYAEYAQLINDDYVAYINKRNEGVFAETEHVVDGETLKQAELSSDEENEHVFPEFNEDKHMENPEMFVGLIFSTVDIYRKALRMFSIKKGFELQFKKNDPGKVLAVCKKLCGWRIYASYYRGTKAMQIKSIYGNPHRCPWSYRNKSANAKWLSSQFLNELADDPNWKLKGFMKAMKRKFTIHISKEQAYRAKKKALLTIKGQYKDQYLRLRDYCATIMCKNPGSAAFLMTDRMHVNQNPVFKRMFLMFVAQKEGIQACRPVIGVDACHLRGIFGGHLLHAVARDANNQMYPLAMAVVESECKDRWGWFLEILVEHIGDPADKGWVFISDRQKGLVETFETKFPGVEHRFCVRHLYVNFKLRFKDKALRDILWSASRAYTIDTFEQKMSMLQQADSDAHKWLSDIPPHLWARCFFNTRSKCDLLSNNISECFNKYINNARDEPVLTMLEMIRRMLMCRYQEKREWIAKIKGNICPKIHEKVEANKANSMEFDAHKASEGLWEVATYSGSFVINFSTASCTCREWDMTGIPCIHACSAIMHEGKGEVAEFVHPYYNKESYKKAYAGVIVPIPDRNLWVNSNGDPTEPPIIRKRPGRPKKLRRKSADEIREKRENCQMVTRKGHTYTCGNCLQPGHNAKGCKNPEHPNKRKKKSTQDQVKKLELHLKEDLQLLLYVKEDLQLLLLLNQMIRLILQVKEEIKLNLQFRWAEVGVEEEREEVKKLLDVQQLIQCLQILMEIEEIGVEQGGVGHIEVEVGVMDHYVDLGCGTALEYQAPLSLYLILRFQEVQLEEQMCSPLTCGPILHKLRALLLEILLDLHRLRGFRPDLVMSSSLVKTQVLEPMFIKIVVGQL